MEFDFKVLEITMMTLKSLCIQQIVSQIVDGSSLLKNAKGKYISLLPSFSSLPSSIAEQVLHRCVQELRDTVDSKKFNEIISAAFNNAEKTPLRFLDFRNAVHVSAKTLSALLRSHQRVKYLDIRGCQVLTKENPLSLTKDFPPILEALFMDFSFEKSFSSIWSLRQILPLASPFSKLTNLHTLVISGVDVDPHESWYRCLDLDRILGPVIRNLKYLDLSGCYGVNKIRILRNATQMEKLVLYNTEIGKDFIEQIGQLKCLSYLDISYANLIFGNSSAQGIERHVVNGSESSAEEIKIRFKIMLPLLNHLDISGVDISNLSLVLDQFQHLQSDSGHITLDCKRISNPVTEEYTAALKVNINRVRPLTTILFNMLNKEDVEQVSGEMIRMRLDSLIQIFNNPTLPSETQELGLQYLDKLVETSKTLGVNKHKQSYGIFECTSTQRRLLIQSLFAIIHNYQADPNSKALHAASQIIQKLDGLCNTDKSNFKRFSTIILNIRTKNMALSPKGFLTICGLLELITEQDKHGVLSHIKIVEKLAKTLEILHAQWWYERQSFVPILHSIWQSILAIFRLESDAPKHIFLQRKLLSFIYGALYYSRFDCSSPQLSGMLDQLATYLDSGCTYFKKKRILKYSNSILQIRKQIEISQTSKAKLTPFPSQK